jgi:hypothetical protein
MIALIPLIRGQSQAISRALLDFITMTRYYRRHQNTAIALGRPHSKKRGLVNQRCVKHSAPDDIDSQTANVKISKETL